MRSSSCRYASAERCRLMKPGPAISAFASNGLAGRAATISSASSRGLRRAAFAILSAMLVAKSPCAGSRVRSRSTPGGPSFVWPGTSVPAGNAARACSTSWAICCFKENLLMNLGDAWEAQVYVRTPGSRRAGSGRVGLEEFKGIDVHGPADLADLGQFLQTRNPSGEQLLQRSGCGCLQQKLGAEVSATTLHPGRCGPEDSDRATGHVVGQA